MKVEVMDLVKATKGVMRKVVQLDAMIEDLFVYQVIDRETYEPMVAEFLRCLEDCYGGKFVDDFFMICNSSQYVENL